MGIFNKKGDKDILTNVNKAFLININFLSSHKAAKWRNIFQQKSSNEKCTHRPDNEY